MLLMFVCGPTDNLRDCQSRFGNCMLHAAYCHLPCDLCIVSGLALHAGHRSCTMRIPTMQMRMHAADQMLQHTHTLPLQQIRRCTVGPHASRCGHNVDKGLAQPCMIASWHAQRESTLSCLPAHILFAVKLLLLPQHSD